MARRTARGPSIADRRDQPPSHRAGQRPGVADQQLRAATNARILGAVARPGIIDGNARSSAPEANGLASPTNSSAPANAPPESSAPSHRAGQRPGPSAPSHTARANGPASPTNSSKIRHGGQRRRRAATGAAGGQRRQVHAAHVAFDRSPAVRRHMHAGSGPSAAPEPSAVRLLDQ